MSGHEEGRAPSVRLDGPAPAAGTATAPAGAQAPAGLAPAPAGRAGGDAEARARRRWPRLVAALTLAGVVGAGGAWWWQSGRASAGGDGTAEGAVATSTAPVVRRTLTATEQVDGTLGYSGSDQISFGRQGTVTWLPAEGAKVVRGATIYKVDDEPVPLLYGTLPFWRDLAAGVDNGRDVTQLEQNLKALGYDPGTVDDHFSSATRQALKDWQEDRGVEETGEFRRGDAALAPGPVRIAEQAGTVGGAAAPGQPALKVTATTRQVDVDLPTSKQALVAKGDAVQITLPSGRTIEGRVSEVSRVATAADSDGQDGDDGETTVGVTITLDDPKAAGALDQAPVDVDITTETSKDALAVPVYALLALAEGGYAVEVDEAGARHLVPVELGLFADGLVEVTVNGDALREGAQVVVPA